MSRRWRNDPIPVPRGTGAGGNWLKGYQERNKDQLLEILGGVQEMAEEVGKVRPETWKAVTQAVRTVGHVFGANQAIGQIQNTLAMPSRILGSQLMFGLEGAMVPYTNQIRHLTAGLNRVIREQQQAANIYGTLGGAIFGGLLGYAVGGPSGAIVGSQVFSTLFGGAIPTWEVKDQARYTGGGGFWAPSDEGISGRLLIGPGDEGLGRSPEYYKATRAERAATAKFTRLSYGLLE